MWFRHDPVNKLCNNFAQRVKVELQGVHEILCFFPRSFNTLRPILCQHCAAVGCTKNGHPIRVTVHSYLLLRRVALRHAEVGCSDREKNTISNEHPVATK